MAFRNKQYVLQGAPDVKGTGGFRILGLVTDTTKYPTDATAALDAAFAATAGGYVSEDGLTKTVDRSTEKIKDWAGDTILIVQTDHSVVLKFTVMESANADVLKMIYGEENVTVSQDGRKITTVDTSDEMPHQGLEFAMLGGRGSKIRVFAPDTQITSVGDVSFIKSDVIKYELELECFDPSGDGKKLWQFMDLEDVPADAVTGDASAAGGGSTAGGGNATAGGTTPAATPAALTITTTSPLPTGTHGQAYTAQLAATGGTAPYTWAANTGSAIPTGLTLNASTGAITGTVTNAGPYNFTIKVTDSATPAATATKAMNITMA